MLASHIVSPLSFPMQLRRNEHIQWRRNQMSGSHKIHLWNIGDTNASLWGDNIPMFIWKEFTNKLNTYSTLKYKMNSSTSKIIHKLMKIYQTHPSKGLSLEFKRCGVLFFFIFPKKTPSISYKILQMRRLCTNP